MHGFRVNPRMEDSASTRKRLRSTREQEVAETPKITTETGQIGYDLNSIIRDILQRIRRDRGWSEARFGRELGIPQTTMNRLMSPKGKFDL